MSSTMLLPVALTPDERNHRVSEVLEHVGAIAAAKLQMDTIRRAHKDEVATHQERLDELIRILGANTEERPVPVDWVAVIERATLSCYRIDTGEVVDSRPMTPGEMQQALQVAMPFAEEVDEPREPGEAGEDVGDDDGPEVH